MGAEERNRNEGCCRYGLLEHLPTRNQWTVTNGTTIRISSMALPSQGSSICLGIGRLTKVTGNLHNHGGSRVATLDPDRVGVAGGPQRGGGGRIRGGGGLGLGIGGLMGWGGGGLTLLLVNG